jgi:hypothetical protein
MSAAPTLTHDHPIRRTLAGFAVETFIYNSIPPKRSGEYCRYRICKKNIEICTTEIPGDASYKIAPKNTRGASTARLLSPELRSPEFGKPLPRGTRQDASI